MSAWKNIYQKAQKQVQGVKDVQEFNILLKYHYKSEGKLMVADDTEPIGPISKLFARINTESLSHTHPQINLR